MLDKEITKLERYIKNIREGYNKEQVNKKQERLMEIGDNLKEILRLHKLKQEDLGFIIKRNISYVSNRLNAKAEFTEEEQRAIRAYFKLDKDFFKLEEIKEETLTVEDIYIKYNKLQYEVSNMKDYNKMNEEMSKLFYELLDELVELWEIKEY